MRMRFTGNQAKAARLLSGRLRLEWLEPRLYLHGDALDSDLAAGSRQLLASSDPAWPALVGSTIPDDIDRASLSSGVVSAATYALSSVPILNSLAGAAVSLYLDFAGRFDASWGAYTNLTTPAYDQDGDATTFSDGELSSIQNIWQAVAEDYAPFKINVTTVSPSSFANGVAVLIAIGGSGSWTGGTYGGISYVNSFTNSLPNEAYVFSSNLGNGYAKYVADAVSHEAGHAFGLQHQSLYGANGAKLNDYYQGPGDGTAPLMGNSYAATLSRWWNGTSTSSTTYQDDMAVLARSANGFGYRVDDHGNTAATATALAFSAGQWSAAGIITTTSDLDYFSFSTTGAQVTFSANVAAYNNLDLRLELRDAGGSLIDSAAPTSSFGATITATLAAGSYRIVVASGGGYGNVGQYTVSGTIAPDATVAAPTNLAAVVAGGQVQLSWTDNSTVETSYYVDRNSDGTNWSTLVILAANSTAYSDANVLAGGTYYYRVWAANATHSSNYSATVQVTLAPPVPALVVARNLFYNQSAFDDGTSAISPLDDNAIAVDKTAYLPNGTTATFVNVSSYTRGINGIMIDLAGNGAHAAIDAGDFLFKVGDSNTPDSWAAAAAPSAISVRLGAGVGGSDRVEITWANRAIANCWLEVQVLATAHTGLASADLFFFGSKVGDSGTNSPAAKFETNTTDAAEVFATLGPATIINPRDYDRSGGVDTTDAALAFASLGSISKINIGPLGPFAPEGSGSAGDTGIAWSLAAAPTDSAGFSAQPLAVGTAGWPRRADRGAGPATEYFHQLASEWSPLDRWLSANNEADVDPPDADDEMLEALVAGLLG